MRHADRSSGPTPSPLRRRAVFSLRFAILCCYGGLHAASAWSQGAARDPRMQAALAGATQRSGAAAVVLRMGDGAVLASVGSTVAATPGSAVKPLLLQWALQHGVVRPETAVYCRRSLRIGTRALRCTHPADQTTFTAETALAASCNTWFAELGRRMRGTDLEAALQATHLPHTDTSQAGVEQRELTVLGLQGVTATPLQLANAYRALLLNAEPVVLRGLAASVRYGMANFARIDGADLLGKTGTASKPGEAWTHGWFAGALPGRMVVVIYVPLGDGGTAARMAHTFFTDVLAGAKLP